MNVSFNPLAELELNDAADYYRTESQSLSRAFVSEVQRCCELIVEHPESGHIVAGSIRRRLVRRFPYAVLYSVRPDVIRVLAIMNMKRRPAYWSGRT